MARRFYFDLTNGSETIRDERGVEAGDLIEAVNEAQAVLSEMSRNDELSGSGAGWQLLIREASGPILQTLPVDTDVQATSHSTDVDPQHTDLHPQHRATIR